MYVRSVYKGSPRHYLSIEIKDHKFWRLNTHYITTTLQNLGTFLMYVCYSMYVCMYCVCMYEVYASMYKFPDFGKIMIAKVYSASISLWTILPQAYPPLL